MITAFLQLFGKLLLWIYNACHSYALALIIFTLLTKLALFPVSYKGKMSMMQTNALQTELQKLQKQYGKDRERLNEETQKLYEREGVNPMGGCLWSFLPLPILMGLYAIIRRPMLYMMMLTNEEIEAAIAAVDKLGIDMGSSVAYKEMTIAGLMHSDKNVWNAVAGAVGDSASKLVDINFTSFGINMAQIPTWKFWTLHMNWSDIGLFLIPLVVVVVSYAYSMLSQKTNKITMGTGDKDDDNPAAQTTKQMMIMMPLMYLWFGYIMPAGMCVYMIFNSVFMAIQEVICAWMLRGKFAQIQAETERRAALAKEEEKRHKAEIAARRVEEAERLKTKKGRQQAKAEKKKTKDRPNEFTRVGVRAYARGRAYDPNRYPTTPYRDPQDVLDEAALEAALGRKGKLKLEEPEVLPEVVETVEAVEAAPVEEVVEAATQTADEMFESIQKDLEE
ncbi:MAG: membrane protein insertase YidC [Oscillospiraceae bacterium]|nr:membrane protein insertase YidC [Oscillospiraceae bacterium]